MKKITLFLTVLAALFFVACKYTQPTKNCSNFEELTDPTADTATTAWNNVKEGLHASFATIDERYAKSLVPEVIQTDKATITGWKGERLSAQMILWSVDGAQRTECSVSDFKSDNGAMLSGEIAKPHFVRYVMTDIFEPGCGYRKPEDFPASLAADMLDNIDCFDIPARTARPVWVTVDIPRDAKEGNYNAEVNVTVNGKSKHKFNLELVVQNKTMPEVKDWAFHLDLWQHPSAVARVHNLEMWSDAHFNAIKPYMEMLANAGQKVITATLNKDPWNVQTYDPYADMIKWTLKENGEWEYDYTVFDRWVQMMMDLGVKKMLNCYSLVPWNNEIHYFDAKADSMVNVKADPGTKIFTDLWTPFLKDFVKHLDSKGWTSITNIAMDERPPKMMKEAINLVQKVAPQLGISLAAKHKRYKEYQFIKDLCVEWVDTVEPEN